MVGKLLAVCAALALSACASISAGEGGMSPGHPNDFIYGKTQEELKTTITAIAGEVTDLESDYYQASTDEDRRVIRNHIVSKMREGTWEFWRRYEPWLYGHNAAFQTGVETTTGILSGAAAITTPPSAKSILAALSAAFSNFGASYAKNMLGQQALPALLHQMESDIALAGQTISLGLAKTDAQYPLANAYADLQEYAMAMSVPHALASLSASASKGLATVKDDTAKTNAALLQAQTNAQIQSMQQAPLPPAPSR